MKNNIYVGNRYVPVFADPVEWDNLRSYESLTIVTYHGTSYTSKKAVPAGINLDNTAYWVATGNYNAQVEAYRQETQELSEDVDNIKIYVTPQMYGAKGDNTNDDTQAFIDAIAAASTKDGVVYIPKGIYKISNTLQLPAQLAILGAGESITYLNYTGSGSLFEVKGDARNKKIGNSFDRIGAIGTSNSTFLNLEHGNNIHVNNVITNGFNSSFVVNDCGNSYFDNIFIVNKNAGAVAFSLLNGSVSNSYSNIAIAALDAGIHTSYGFIANTGNIADFTINYLDTANLHTSIIVNGVDNTSTPATDIRLNNIVVDNSLVGVDLENINGSAVIDGGWVNLNKNAECAIKLVNTNNITITNVVFQSVAQTSSWTGIVGSSCSNTMILSNTFINVNTAISATNMSKGVINNNDIRTQVNDSPSIYIPNSGYWMITNNIINSGTNASIITQGPQQIDNNIIKSTATNPISGDSSTIILNNLIDAS